MIIFESNKVTTNLGTAFKAAGRHQHDVGVSQLPFYGGRPLVAITINGYASLANMIVVFISFKEACRESYWRT